MIKKALVVGINSYKSSAVPRLNGCVNDMEDIAALMSSIGYEVFKLRDEAATHSAITGWLNEARAQANAGVVSGLVYFHAGHGTQIKDTGGEEADGLDEGILTYDSAQVGGAWSNLILDDWMSEWMKGITALIPIGIIADTCYSGGMNRDIPPQSSPRFVSPPGGSHIPTGAPRIGLSPMEITRKDPDRIMFSACRGDQTAADALIDGRWRGAFSWAYGVAARERIRSNGALLLRVRSLIQQKGFVQIPQMEILP